MSFAEFSKNLKSSFAEGLQLTETGLKKGATRQYNKAQEALAQYLAYDPSQDPGGAVSDQPGTPTYRDLMGMRQEYLNEAKRRMNKAGRMANDIEWQTAADKLWASDLATGFSKYANIAAAALESGDHDTVERALNHAAGLMPSGGAQRFKRNKDGNFEMTVTDETTGKDVEKRIVTPTDLRVLAASAGDPNKFLALSMQLQQNVLLHRKQELEEDKFGHTQDVDERKLGQKDEEIGLKRDEVQIARAAEARQLESARAKAGVDERQVGVAENRLEFDIEQAGRQLDFDREKQADLKAYQEVLGAATTKNADAAMQKAITAQGLSISQGAWYMARTKEAEAQAAFGNAVANQIRQSAETRQTYSFWDRKLNSHIDNLNISNMRFGMLFKEQLRGLATAMFVDDGATVENMDLILQSATGLLQRASEGDTVAIAKIKEVSPLTAFYFETMMGASPARGIPEE